MFAFKRSVSFLLLVSVLSSASFVGNVRGEESDSLRILFLGDNGHHRPAERFAEFAPRMKQRGIEVAYTDRLDDLNDANLVKYDGLIVFANHDLIGEDQAASLLRYIRGGGGFVPLHCASYCFRNSPEYVQLVGGQFQRHGGEVFGTEIDRPDHPVMQGFGGFRSWDETYIHTLENPDREILEYRRQGEQAPGREREPYTWVRKFGEGRVFYTAWGHDQRTWGNPGFVNLVERGIRWVCGGDPALAGPYRERAPFEMPAMTELAKDVKPFEYDEVGNKIPNYLAGEGWGAQGEPLTTMQRPLDPEESLKHYVTPENFAVELFASEKQMGAKPIAMNWDERGRLWVCQTIDYPNELRQPETGNDRITICEDTDGDQVADRFVVFAEKLSIPTALVHYRGGVIVQDGVRTVYLKDTNGDDIADIRKVLITGWQLGDTHGGVSNFRYGLDNWIWGMQGYNNSTPEFAGGKTGPFRMGFFRFRLDDQDPPNVTELEFVRSTDNNTWGLGISEEGLIFGSTANRNPSVFMPIPNRYYERVRGWGPEQLRSIADTYLFKPITDKVRQVDHHGGYTAGAGHSLYTARRYPEMWWNRTAFVNGPTGHLVGIFVLEPNGAGFTSHSPGNLLASDDEWSAPILSEVGPDGNVWVIDWYNYIVQHNPTPQGFKTGRGNAYESDLRDKTHGRIVRVVYQEGPADPQPILTLEDPAGLVAALGHSNQLWRLHAQRLLIERGRTDVVDQLVLLIKDTSVDGVGINPGAIHALQTLRGLGAIAQEVDGAVGRAVIEALKHPSAGVRRAAIEVLPITGEATDAILQSGVLFDGDAQVRMAAILGLADRPAGKLDSGEVVAGLVDDATVMDDRWLADAVTSAAAGQAEAFLAASMKGSNNLSEGSQKVIGRVAEHISRGRPEAERLAALFESMKGANPKRLRSLLDGLIAGWPSDYAAGLTPASERVLTELVEEVPAEVIGQLVTLAGRMQTKVLDAYAEKAAAQFVSMVEDRDLADAKRIEAAAQLIALLPTSDKATVAIIESIEPQMDIATAQAFLQQIAASRAEGTGASLVESVPGWTPAVRQRAVALLMSRPAWTTALIEGLKAGELNMTDLALDQRQALANHPDRSIREAATELMKSGGGLPNADRVAVIQRYLASTKNTGSVDRGRELFKEHCGKCHKHGDMGQEIGPELTGMAVHPKEELLVHILDPSRSVEGNFRSYVVLTGEGRVLTGMLAGESRTTIELIDTNGKRETIPRVDIDQINASTKSVMPEGFEDQLSVESMTDLLEFLTARGRFLPLDLRQSMTLPTDRPMFYGGGGEVLALKDWGTKVVDGIPFSLIPPGQGRIANAIMLYGPEGRVPPTLPKQVTIEVGTSASAIHMLTGVGGWNSKQGAKDGPAVMTVRLHYADGTTEDHVLKDGVHFADYIGPFDVPGSKKAFDFDRGYQMRYLAVRPSRPKESIETIELIKAPHPSSPITMAMTLEE